MIDVINLWMKYANSDTMVVKGNSFTIKEGQFFSLVGPSGCGKTTTLRSIAGLETPEDGEISINNQIVYSKKQKINIPTHKREIGMVFQSYAIWPHMSVFENVAFPLTNRKQKMDKAELEKKVKDVLEMVGLSSFIHRDATLLSGGQQQRLALARATIGQPRVLLLDEPLSNLDAKLREQMRLELRNLQQQLGITTLYVTHDQTEALSMSDNVAIMNQGKIIQLGAPEEIYRHPKTEFVALFIGNTNLLDGDWSGERFIFNGEELECGSTTIDRSEWGKVSVRPENIEIGTDLPDGQSNVLNGIVSSSLFLGQYYDCTVILSETRTIRVFVHFSKKLSVGERVKLHIKPQFCNIIRKDGLE